MTSIPRETTYTADELMPAWEELAASIGLNLSPSVCVVLARQVEAIIDYHVRNGGPVMTEAPSVGSWEWDTLRHILIKDLAADAMRDAEVLAPPRGFEGGTPSKWNVSKTALKVTRTWSAVLGSGKVRATLTEAVTVDGEIVRGTPAIQMARAGCKPEQVADLVADLELARQLGVAL